MPTEQVNVQEYDATGALVADRVETITVSTESVNRLSLEDSARTALANNRTFLAVTSPTNAQIAAQVKALSRQNNALIRLLLNQLDATD